MSKEIIENLEKEVIKLTEKLETLDDTDAVYEDTIKRIKALTEILNEQRESVSKMDKQFENVVSIAKLGVDLAGVVLPIMLYSTWLKRGFEFEETGMISSQTFKGLIGKIKPTK